MQYVYLANIYIYTPTHTYGSVKVLNTLLFVLQSQAVQNKFKVTYNSLASTGIFSYVDKKAHTSLSSFFLLRNTMSKYIAINTVCFWV